MSRVFVIQGTMATTGSDTCYTKTANGITTIGQANAANRVPDPSSTASDLSEMSIPIQGNTYDGADAYNTAEKYHGFRWIWYDQAAGRYDGDDLFMKYRWALDKPFTPKFESYLNDHSI